MRNYRLIFKAGVIIFVTFMMTCTSQCIGMMITGNSSGNSSFNIPSSVETSAPPIVSSEEDSDFLPNLSNEYKESINTFKEDLTEKIQPLFNDKLEVLLNDVEIEEINYESAKLNIQLSTPLEELNIKGNTYGGLQVKEIEISYDAETDALKIEGKDIKGNIQFENIIYGEEKTGVITKKKSENSGKVIIKDEIKKVLKLFSEEEKINKIVLFCNEKGKEEKETKITYSNTDKEKGEIKALSYELKSKSDFKNSLLDNFPPKGETSNPIESLFDNRIDTFLKNAKISTISYDSDNLKIKLNDPLKEISIKGETYQGLEVKELKVSYNSENNTMIIIGFDTEGKKEFENIIYGKGKTGVIKKNKGKNTLVEKNIENIKEVLKLFQEGKINKISVFYIKDGKEEKLSFSTSDKKERKIKASSLSSETNTPPITLDFELINDSNNEVLSATSSALDDNFTVDVLDVFENSDYSLINPDNPLKNIGKELSTLSATSTKNSVSAFSEDLLLGLEDTVESASLNFSSEDSVTGPKITIENGNILSPPTIRKIKGRIQSSSVEENKVIGQLEIGENENIHYEATFDYYNKNEIEIFTFEPSEPVKYKEEAGNRKKTTKIRLVEVNNKKGFNSFSMVGIYNENKDNEKSPELSLTILGREESNPEKSGKDRDKKVTLMETLSLRQGIEYILPSKIAKIELSKKAKDKIIKTVVKKYKKGIYPRKLVITFIGEGEEGSLKSIVGEKQIQVTREGRTL